VAGEGLGGQRGQHMGKWMGPWLRDQLPVQYIGEGPLNAVVDGVPAVGGATTSTHYFSRDIILV